MQCKIIVIKQSTRFHLHNKKRFRKKIFFVKNLFKYDETTHLNNLFEIFLPFSIKLHICHGIT